MTTSHDMIRGAVLKNGFLWTDVARKIERDGGIPYEEACDMVAECVMKQGCTIAVAAAIIDMCAEKERIKSADKRG